MKGVLFWRKQIASPAHAINIPGNAIQMNAARHEIAPLPLHRSCQIATYREHRRPPLGVRRGPIGYQFRDTGHGTIEQYWAKIQYCSGKLGSRVAHFVGLIMANSPVSRVPKQPLAASKPRSSDDLADPYEARLRLQGSRGDAFIVHRTGAATPERPTTITPIPFGRANRRSSIITPLLSASDAFSETTKSDLDLPNN